MDQGLFDGPEAVQVLDLDDRRGDFLAVFVDVQVDVGIAAQRAFLHLAVGDFEIAQSQSQLLQAAAGVGRAADLGLGDDLEQRNPRPVQIDLGKAAVAVRQLAGVFLEVDPSQMTPAAAATVLAHGDFEVTAPRKRQVVLADLIVLGQVGIVVVLAVPLGKRSDLGVQRHGRLQGQVKRLAVHHRQRAGQAERDRVGLRIGRQTEVGAAPREHLALGLKLNVDFQADDDFVVHYTTTTAASNASRWRARTPGPCGAACPRQTGAPKSCMPIGRLALVSPHGMLIPGMPARLAVIV